MITSITDIKRHFISGENQYSFAKIIFCFQEKFEKSDMLMNSSNHHKTTSVQWVVSRNGESRSNGGLCATFSRDYLQARPFMAIKY